jgi:N-acetylmuramoyl-L-alanine amidase
VKTQASTTLTRTTLTRRARVFRLGAALLLVLLPLVSASARVHHNDAWARQQFTKAERMREALNGRPVGERTRREYQRVIDSYRRVYFGSPASSKADPSVVATAELMVEMGRRFDDNKILRGAIDEYRFLRKEYPGSKYRFAALFTIGEIYKDDLHQPEEARTTFTDFVQRYPRNRLADDARAAMKEIDAEAAEKERSAEKAARKRRPNIGTSVGASGASASAGSSSDGAVESANARRSALPRVTGVRHWSTPDYTRVAIDVEQEVKFGSQRISHPDRIFFDLRDTTLASTLVGKTFDVDDGFLKKIRVAEFEPGRTRIVLEVDNLASYDAFLLPDPYRLIIDIHGKDIHGKQKRAITTNAETDAAVSAASDDDSSEAAASSGGGSKFDRRKAQQDSDTNAVGSRNPGLVETDLPPEGNGNGVIKTTVAVKGSNRRIPKTIVAAEVDANVDPKIDASGDANVNANGSAPSTVASLEHEKLRPEVTTGQGADVYDADEARPAKSDSRSSASSSSSSHRKKSPYSPTATASDAAERRSDDLRSETRLNSREARPTAAGNRSLTRALGLKIGKIVIDPGHGGHDTGTIGPNGLLEKDVVLDVAKRLGRLLEARLGAEVIYTRRDDTFIPLETRTAIANRERADLFISIHANSSRDSDARGVETYYLNFTSSPEALEVAARENAVSEKSIYELQDLVKKIALKEKIEESREFAGDVQESLYGGLALNNAHIRNRGVKKAPFIVLIGANMPSILAEISFVSNPTDERKLETSEHRQRIAESLYRGVAKYANGLSGVKVASKFDKQGQ